MHLMTTKSHMCQTQQQLIKISLHLAKLVIIQDILMLFSDFYSHGLTALWLQIVCMGSAYVFVTNQLISYTLYIDLSVLQLWAASTASQLLMGFCQHNLVKTVLSYVAQAQLTHFFLADNENHVCVFISNMASILVMFVWLTVTEAKVIVPFQQRTTCYIPGSLVT